MMRLDVALRVDATCDTLRGGDGGVLHTWTIPHGLYLTAAALTAEIQAWAVADIDASATVAIVDGRLVVTWPGTVELEWPCPRLRDWLGFTATVSASSPQTAPNLCRGVFVPSLPWSAPSPLSWLLYTSRSPTWRGAGRSCLRGIHREWSVTARATADELAHLRVVLGSLLAGMPATLWQDVDNADPFGVTDPYGYVQGWLSPSAREYVERWMALPARTACEVDLVLAEYVA